MKGGHTQHSAV